MTARRVGDEVRPVVVTCPTRSSSPAMRSRYDHGRDGHGGEAVHAGADHRQAAAGRGADGTGQAGGRGGPGDRGDGADLLPLAGGIRRPEARPGEAAEAARSGECPAAKAVADLTLEKVILKEAASETAE